MMLENFQNVHTSFGTFYSAFLSAFQRSSV